MPYGRTSVRRRRTTRSSTRVAVRRPSRKKTTTRSLPLDKRIRSITMREMETKVKSFSIFDDQPILAVGLNNAGTKGLLIKNTLGPTTFSISQGTNQQERVGNSISNCSLNLKGFIHSMPTHITTNVSPYPFEVHVLVYKTKQSSSGNPDTILQNTNNTNVNIIGNASSTLLPWNRKGFTIKKHRVFRMKANVVVATSTTPNALGLENSDFNGTGPQFFRRFSFDVNIRNKLTFDDAGTTPTNDWCSIGVYVINGDGTTLLGTQQRAKITIAGTLKYKDA